MKPKKFVSPLLLLLAFIGLLVFISTSFEMSTTAAGNLAQRVDFDQALQHTCERILAL